jgi:hypothetical protein
MLTLSFRKNGLGTVLAKRALFHSRLESKYATGGMRRELGPWGPSRIEGLLLEESGGF